MRRHLEHRRAARDRRERPDQQPEVRAQQPATHAVRQRLGVETNDAAVRAQPGDALEDGDLAQRRLGARTLGQLAERIAQQPCEPDAGLRAAVGLHGRGACVVEMQAPHPGAVLESSPVIQRARPPRVPLEPDVEQRTDRRQF